MEPEISDEYNLIFQPNINTIDNNDIINRNFYKYSIIIIIIVVLIIPFSLEKKQKDIIDDKSIEIIKNKVKDELKDELEDEIKKYHLKNELKEEIKKEFFDEESNIKVCLCSIGKKENLYVEEFVNNYIKLGYDKIFLYDNNDKDDERMDDVLKKQIANNFVKITDFRGFRGKKLPQFEAYYDCYEKNSKYCDWLSFFDLDEFLYLKNNKNIKQILSDKKFEKCDNIKINWIVYSDNNLVYYDDRKIQQRFTEQLLQDVDNIHIKSTVRGHMKTNYWSSYGNPHVSTVKVNACLLNGQNINSEYNSPFHTPPNYEVGYIKHYITKTIEEYCNKVKRGYPDRKYKVDDKFKKQRLDYFFGRNKKTKEKLEVIKKLLNYDYK